MKEKFPSVSDIQVGWLSSHLSRKAIIALVALAVLSGVVLSLLFSFYLGEYARAAYENTENRLQVQSDAICDYLRTHEGDFDGLAQFVRGGDLSCEVVRENGEVLFSYLPYAGESKFSVSGSTTVALSSGSRLTVHTWMVPMEENEVSRMFIGGALKGLVIFIICVFVVVGVMLYLLVLSPIIGLRRAVREYYEYGAMPKKSQRRDEIGRLWNTFVTMAGVLEEKEQTERRLIASVSHDIKTPLTSVMGYSERVLSAQLSPEKQNQYLHSIYDKALAIKAVVDEFDEYLEAGFQENVPLISMCAGDLCDKIREEYQDELQDAGISFAVDCSCPSAKILCSFEHLRRVFGNLITNSIQHAASDALALHLICRREGAQVVFLFCDNGKGVAPELLNRIFEPLFTTDRGRKVSGLGLAICRSIIRAHNGSIQAENLDLGGFAIEIRLPLAQQQPFFR